MHEHLSDMIDSAEWKKKFERNTIERVDCEIQYHQNQVGYSERLWQRPPENPPLIVPELIQYVDYVSARFCSIAMCHCSNQLAKE
jgi:hypothetical protein